MYLSLLLLDPRSREAHADLADPYQMHRTIARGFGEGAEAYRSARVLFRTEEGRNGCPFVLVQSLLEPDWRVLTARPRYLRCTPRVKELRPVVRANQHLAFRLRANPTVKRDGRRHPIWEPRQAGETLGDSAARLRRVEAAREQWLRRKGEEGGFAVEQVDIQSEPVQVCHRLDDRAVFNAVRFDGILRVTDAQAFAQTLEAGIGSGKAFGFGLLSVARF